MRTPIPRHIREAFRAVDRRRFLLPESRDQAASDRPLLIGHGQTNSQPSTVADMLALLDIQPGQRILDVGSGAASLPTYVTQTTSPRAHAAMTR